MLRAPVTRLDGVGMLCAKAAEQAGSAINFRQTSGEGNLAIWVQAHISNIHRRGAFRQQSYVWMAAVGAICGLGVRGYVVALQAMADILEENR